MTQCDRDQGWTPGAVRLRNKVAAALEESVSLLQALAILQRDLANLVAPGQTLAGALQSHPTNLTLLPGLMNEMASSGD